MFLSHYHNHHTPSLSRYFWQGNYGNKGFPANIAEHDDRYEVALSAPGLDKEKFHVSVDKNVLTIAFDAADEHADERDEAFTWKEFSHASFAREFILPKSVKIDEINAEYINGILTVNIPKDMEAIARQTRTISVQ